MSGNMIGMIYCIIMFIGFVAVAVAAHYMSDEDKNSWGFAVLVITPAIWPLFFVCLVLCSAIHFVTKVIIYLIDKITDK